MIGFSEVEINPNGYVSGNEATINDNIRLLLSVPEGSVVVVVKLNGASS